MQTLDCRGQACPLPVIAVKRALENAGGNGLTILLDLGAPHANVTRFLQNRGYSATETVSVNDVSILVAATTDQPETPVGETPGKRVFLITSDQLGEGPAELGRLLMKNFIISLLEQTILPDRMFFLNTGIHLTTEGSEVVAALAQLGNRGVEIQSCGLCLDYFQKKELLRCGTVTNMFTTAEALLQADSVIKL